MKLKYTDAHVHTKYSPDADQNATFNAYIQKAKDLGLEEIIFTDHLDLDPAHPLFEVPIDYETYFTDYKNRIQVDGVKTKVGIEIGYQPHTIKKSMEIVNKYPFEYIILSIHYIDKLDLYTKEYFKGKSKNDAYNRYFEVCLEAIRNTEKFDAFGHFDYISRYSELGLVEYENHKNIIDEILTTLINKGKYLEVNTSGLETEGKTYPSDRIISRYVELGGKKLILASDAHRTSELARYFTECSKYIK